MIKTSRRNKNEPTIKWKSLILKYLERNLNPGRPGYEDFLIKSRR
jgi:hypothetical protein